jgi:hypothetical protein
MLLLYIWRRYVIDGEKRAAISERLSSTIYNAVVEEEKKTRLMSCLAMFALLYSISLLQACARIAICLCE